MEPAQGIREYSWKWSDTYCRATDKYEHDRDIECLYRFHDIEIFSEQYQNETTRNTRQDHRADRNGSAKEDKEQICRCLRRCGNGNVISNDSPDDKTQYRFPVPLFDIFRYEPGGSQYQPEKEGPHQDRMGNQQPGNELCQRENADPDAGNDSQQEVGIYRFPESGDLTGEE